MILYTIMPIDVVLKNSESNSNNDYVEIDYQGERVVVSQLENNQYVINRVISTSPKSYLNPSLQPGTVIKGEI